jgi:hypothetical protein
MTRNRDMEESLRSIDDRLWDLDERQWRQGLRQRYADSIDYDPDPRPLLPKPPPPPSIWSRISKAIENLFTVTTPHK